MTPFTQRELDYLLAERRLGRLATVAGQASAVARARPPTEPD